MRAYSLKILREGIELFAQSVEIRSQVLGVFLDLHAAEAHGDDAQVGVQGVRRNGKDAAAAAVFVERLAFAVHAHQQTRKKTVSLGTNINATSRVSSSGTMYFLEMESAWFFTAVTNARRLPRLPALRRR